MASEAAYKAKWMTAREMAETSHNLSRDSNAATLANGEVFRWSDHFHVWAGPFPQTAGDAKPPRRARKAA